MFCVHLVLSCNVAYAVLMCIGIHFLLMLILILVILLGFRKYSISHRSFIMLFDWLNQKVWFVESCD